MIIDLTREEALGFADESARLYQAAFGAGDEETERFTASYRRCVAEYDGVQVAVVRAGGRSVGFSYGFTYQPGHWWPDQVGPALARAGLSVWTQNAFELVELAVHPDHQGAGLGGHLLRHALCNARHQRVLLATEPGNPARRLYRRSGFVELLPTFAYPATGSAAVVLGFDRHPPLAADAAGSPPAADHAVANAD